MSLVVNELSKSFPTRGGDLVVLRGINLVLQSGEALAILGPSGSGKSTLLHLIGTLDRPTSGSVRLDDQDPFASSERELAAFRNRKIGFVFQDHHLLPQCTVLENVLVPTLAGNSESRFALRERAHRLLDRAVEGRDQRRDEDVLEHGALRQQTVILEHEADALVPERREIVR